MDGLGTSFEYRDPNFRKKSKLIYLEARILTFNGPSILHNHRFAIWILYNTQGGTNNKSLLLAPAGVTYSIKK